MSGNYLTWRVINESRQIASEKGYPSAALNHMMAEFIDVGYVANQALAIRRLTEKEGDKPAKQVISLRRLVNDIKVHQDLFTREIFVGFDGAPFDPGPGVERKTLKISELLSANKGCMVGTEREIAGPEAGDHAERLHRAFDRLLKTAPRPGKRTDNVPDCVFKELGEKLNDRAIEKAIELCNKRIAHAADAASRSWARHQPTGVSFNEIDSAHQAIITIAHFVSAYLLYDRASKSSRLRSSINSNISTPDGAIRMALKNGSVFKGYAFLVSGHSHGGVQACAG